jgi:Bacterial HORMA domain 2
MSSIVSVNTYTHSVTFVTDKMLGSLKQIIVGIGLSPTKFVSDWSTNERAVKAWLESKDLVEAVLEITSSTGAFVTRCDFTIDYTYSVGDGAMWVDPDAIKYSIIKLGKIPSECSYRFILRVKPGAPFVDGWDDCQLLSTSGFVKQTLGTTIGTNAIGTQAGYWRKIS